MGVSFFASEYTRQYAFSAEIFGPNKEVTLIPPHIANRADVVLECAWRGNGYFIYLRIGCRCGFLI